MSGAAVSKMNTELNSGEATFRVEAQDCISDIDTTLPNVLGTYTLVKWMEIVSARLINRHLDTERHLSVGKQIDIHHTGMVKLGETVTIVSRLETQERKEATFHISATVGDREIATANHVRGIIPLRVIARMER